MSGILPTRTMSPSRLWRYASIAFAVDVERCLMLVTPRLVRSLRVPWIEMKETSAIGATPTTSRAVRTFCQNRTRGRRIRSPAPRAHLGLTRARLERIVGAQRRTAQSWRGARACVKGPSTWSAAETPARRERAKVAGTLRDVPHARGGQVATGTIKKLVGDRGFGFIQTEDGSDIFFHRSQVEGDAFDTLREGQSVSYEKGMDPRRGKPQAEKVTPA